MKDDSFVHFFGKFFPESMTLAVILSILALIITIPHLGAIKQLELISTGFFDFFSLQMALILWWMLSAVVIESEIVGRLLDKITQVVPLEEKYIISFIAIFSLVIGWINWAFGLIPAILMGHKLCLKAKEKNIKVHYPAVLFASLLALISGAVGLTSPGALTLTDGTIHQVAFLDLPTLSITEFALARANIASFAMMLVGVPIIILLLTKKEKTEIKDEESIIQKNIRNTLKPLEIPPKEEWIPANYLEYTPLLSIIAFVIGSISIGWAWIQSDVTMLGVLFALMMVGLLIQKNPATFTKKTTDSTKWAAHMAVPFLLYGGVYALLSESGIYLNLAGMLETLPITGSYITAFITGLIVPDPGSLWLLVSPILSEAVEITTSVTLAMYASGVSNIWLGFLFAGILSIKGFDWREYVRYAFTITVYVSAVVLICHYLL